MYVRPNLPALVLRSARQVASRRLLIDLGDTAKTVFLAGTGRSGTTWVSNIVNHANAYRLMFEPFNPRQVADLGAFRYRQYLRADNRDPRYLEPARAIVSGAIRHPWIDRLNGKLIARRRLIKDIRAHHLLGWLASCFPGMPIVLLLRHPCAVAHSKLRLGWETHLDEFLAQPELMKDFLEPFRSEIESAQDPFDRHVFQWCIENYLPLHELRGRIHLAFYEGFCVDPRSEIDRLFDFLGLRPNERVFTVLGKPSTVTRSDSPVVTGESLVESWRKPIGQERTRRAVTILSLFGLDTLYSEEALPCPGAAAGRLSGLGAEGPSPVS